MCVFEEWLPSVFGKQDCRSLEKKKGVCTEGRLTQSLAAVLLLDYKPADDHWT